MEFIETPLEGLFLIRHKIFEDDRGLFARTFCKDEFSKIGFDKEFLQFSLEKGNDLITPRPEYHFPGLVAGDQWCLCISRWVEAVNAHCAPLIKLESTHINALKTVPLDILRQYSSEE